MNVIPHNMTTGNKYQNENRGMRRVALSTLRNRFISSQELMKTGDEFQN